jgi:hypothetical protein
MGIMKKSGVLSLLLLLTLEAVCLGDLQVQTLQPNRQDRFYVGSDKDFVGQSFDWSGVGLTNRVSDPNSWATMISPTYFLTAAHFPVYGGETLTFYENNDPSGPSHQYTVESWSYLTTYNGLPSDLRLGKLTEAIPESDNIAYYPILSLPSEDDYVGQMIYVNGKPNRIGRNNIDGLTTVQELNLSKVPTKETVAMQYDYNTVDGLGADECYLIAYDSGGPSFVDVNGQLALVGIHYYNEGTPLPGESSLVSGDSFVPYYIDQLNAHMGSESVSVLVPEPSTLMLLAAGAGTLGVAAWRRPKRAA